MKTLRFKRATYEKAIATVAKQIVAMAQTDAKAIYLDSDDWQWEGSVEEIVNDFVPDYVDDAISDLDKAIEELLE